MYDEKKEKRLELDCKIQSSNTPYKFRFGILKARGDRYKCRKSSDLPLEVYIDAYGRKSYSLNFTCWIRNEKGKIFGKEDKFTEQDDAE